MSTRQEEISNIARDLFRDFLTGSDESIIIFIDGIYYSFYEEYKNDELREVVWDYCATDDFFKMCKKVSFEEFQKRTTK